MVEETTSLQEKEDEKTEAELALEACEPTRSAIEERLKATGTPYYKVQAIAVKVKVGDVAIGYFQEPQRLTKMAAIDAAQRSYSQSGDILLRSTILPESDGRILDDKPENDALYITFILEIQSSVAYYIDSVKKN